jgi:hypothetical protein
VNNEVISFTTAGSCTSQTICHFVSMSCNNTTISPSPAIVAKPKHLKLLLNIIFGLEYAIIKPSIFAIVTLVNIVESLDKAQLESQNLYRFLQNYEPISC